MILVGRIESINLHGVGVFDDVQMDFKPITSKAEDAKKAEIHLLTGPNGCGKSTVLYALARPFESVDFEGSHPVFSRFRTTDDSKSYVKFVFAGSSSKYSVLNRGPTIDRCNGADVDYHHDSFAVFAYSGQRDLEQVSLSEGIKEISISAYENALDFNQNIRSRVLLQWIANNRAQYALAKADSDEEAAGNYNMALSRITQLVFDVCGLEIEFKLERSPLAVSLKMNDENIRFDGLPDGLKSIISWVADLSMRLERVEWGNEDDIFSQPIILFLDEIDIHLHPKWQRRILPAVQKLLPNAQIFASTHSPFVVGSVEDAWVYRLPEPVSGHTSGTIEGIPSGAGKSYQLILEEIFDVDEEFDVETELLFDVFYKVRNSVLKTGSGVDQLLSAARSLVIRGEEADSIVQRELRQVSRLMGEDVSLAQN